MVLSGFVTVKIQVLFSPIGKYRRKLSAVLFPPEALPPPPPHAAREKAAKANNNITAATWRTLFMGAPLKRGITPRQTSKNNPVVPCDNYRKSGDYLQRHSSDGNTGYLVCEARREMRKSDAVICHTAGVVIGLSKSNMRLTFP